jgi:hypothetical protein
LKTIYNYLDKGLFLNISNKDLWEKSKRRNGNMEEPELLTITEAEAA